MMDKYLHVFILCLIIVGCNFSPNWDYYEDIQPEVTICDYSSVNANIDCQAKVPPTSISDMEIDVDIDHEAPYTLDIAFTYNNDTFAIWSKNFTGGCQSFSPKQIIGRQANALYAIIVKDLVGDNCDGTLKRIAIKIDY